MNNILATFIAAYDQNQEITAPPERVLEVLVIAGVLTLRILPGDADSRTMTYEQNQTAPSIDVPARSLFLALKAQLDEEDTPSPEAEQD